MKNVSLNTKESSTKSKGNEFHRVQFDYSRNFVPNQIHELNYDEWGNKMKSHLIDVHPSLWEIVHIGGCKPALGKDGNEDLLLVT